ncbi:MAG: alpha-glucosidase/alpha-galactosidase [Puniceicoccaceae bacterium]
MEEKKKLQGTESDTQDAKLSGLPGRIQRPIKVTVIGAGSNFTPRLVTDILSIPDNAGGTIALVDIDAERLGRMERLIEKVETQLRQEGKEWKIESSTERRDLLPGSDYVLVCIEVNGLECVSHDNDIPAKYGIDQCIGDTLGPGGVMKGLRTIPVFLDIVSDIEELCPRAWVLNYTNPMAMMMLSAFRKSDVTAVGLCHSVQGTSDLMAKRAGIPVEDIEWECAGINHLAWFTRFEHNGEDLYPLLKEKAIMDIAGEPVDEKDRFDHVRKDMMLQFGAFITESSPHLSEYLPYYRKRKEILETYCEDDFPGDGSRFGTRYYADMWPDARAKADEEREQMISGEKEIDWKRSWEYASWIIEAREKDTPFRIHGNVYNRDAAGGQLITNLPADSCVEVSCMVDRSGIHPTRYGELPPQMAAICQTNLNVIDLGARAATERVPEYAIQAMMLDPLTAANCSLKEIREMAGELFEAEASYMPEGFFDK